MKKKKIALNDPPLIFNLFPRFFPSMSDWRGAAVHAADMGFTWIYVNPFHEMGFSGSLYAIRDYYRIDKLFRAHDQDSSDWRPLSEFIETCSKRGLMVMMDLVINHTAFDSVLVDSKPLWFKRNEKGEIVHPFAINPAEPGKITVWGDLAEIDNMESKDRQSLWAYWDKLICFFQDLGILGFRCDAAYQVAAELWKYLISSAKRRDSATIFLAETLGCTLEQIEALHGTGFDYLYNSSKYWEYDQPWCIDQHGHNKKVAPSISFPESHDTPRLAGEFPGTLAVQKSRYLFCAVFSKGLLMTQGYRLKARTPILSEEGNWKILSSYDRDILFLEKSPDGAGAPIMLCVNKNKLNGRTVSREEFPKEFLATKFLRPFSEADLDGAASSGIPFPFELGPAEIVLFFP
jgi:starch synthase (maltosyl-transferring)